MKDSQSNIIDEITRNGDGMTVPEGYFEDFAVKMSGQLPFREELDTPVVQQKQPKNNAWLRMRPYVYMAAMFAGAWCLLKMFSLMSPAAGEASIDNYPALSRALENEQFIDEYIMDCVSTYDMLEESYKNNLDSTDEDFALDYEFPLTEDNTSSETPAYRLPTDGDYLTPPTIE